MAIYHFSMKNISRGKGRSVIAAAAYIGADRLRDERQKCVHDYRKKTGVEHLEIVAPDGAPDWGRDREKLWNAVDAREKRGNSRTAKEIRIALPVELSDEQHVELVRNFVKSTFVSLGVVAEFAIHREHEHNPHVHILLSTRVLTADGFGEKVLELDTKQTLVRFRSEWAQQCNMELQRAGHDIRIDHRSFADQGIDLEPTKHIGIPVKDARKVSWRQPSGCEKSPGECRDDRTVVADSIADHEAILEQNGHKILDRPESALEALALSRATFTRRDIASYLASHMDAERVPLALEKVVNCDEAFFLGRDVEGNDRYSTQSYMRLESETRDFAVKLAARNGHVVSARCVQEPSFARRMGTEQEAAYRYLTQDSGDIAVVQGYAGSGKTYMLGAAREAWEAEGHRVIGAALAAKAAQGLEAESGIKSQTIASLIKSLNWDEKQQSHGVTRFGKKTVLVIDEAGMVGTGDLNSILSHAYRRGMKVALVGDTAQLQAVGAGAMMRAISERVGEAVVSEIRRQKKEAWQREATRMMGRGETKEALRLYEQNGHFVRLETKSEAIESMVKAWSDVWLKDPPKSTIMLAHERADVASANAMARDVLIGAGRLEKGLAYGTVNGKRDFAEGDSLVFLKNDRELAVKNGQRGTVRRVSVDSLVVELDDEDGREVEINVSRYGHFDHGYAVTVHKSQGDTRSRVFVLASSAYDAHVSYVALSRHEEDVRLYWSEDVFGSTDGLIERLSSASSRHNALDYAAAHVLDAAVLGALRFDRIDSEVSKQRQSEFVLEIEELSDEELAEKKAELAEEAKGEVVKPSDLERSGGRLEELSASLQEAQTQWMHSAKEFDREKQDFIDSHQGDEKKARAERTWQMHGPQTQEGLDSYREMSRAFDEREAAIAAMQVYHAESKTAQRAVEEAREQNFKLRLCRERLHLVEREIEQRRIEVLQRQLDAVEFNLQHRVRMWRDASTTSSQAEVDRAYRRDGPLGDVWAQLRNEQRLASNARYELSGAVATRGAWFAPIETELPSDREGLCAAVADATETCQKALGVWGLWRAEHSVAEAHAARGGEGTGAVVYRDLVLAERTHQRAQRNYLERAAFEELDLAEAKYATAARAWEDHKKAHPEEAREAYKGEGEAGRLWKAERDAQRLCASWESTYDWLSGRGRHHIFPQRPGVGEAVQAANQSALALAERWEACKLECDEAELRDARQGRGEAGELYERFRVAAAERQHARREMRIAKTEERLAYLEKCSLAVQRELTECLESSKAVSRAILDQGEEGLLWRLRERLDMDRESTANLLDKLLRVENTGLVGQSECKPTDAELADNRLLVESWLSAEQAFAEQAAAWDRVPTHARRGARMGFGEHAEAHAEYRAVLSRRDGLRERVVRGVREHRLSKIERRHFGGLLKAKRYATPENEKTEAVADDARRHVQALFDQSAGRAELLLRPQPEPTAERQQAVENTFHRASAAWNNWRDGHSDAEVMRARLGEPEYLGTAMYEAYRRADIERQNIREVMTHSSEHEREREKTQHLATEAELDAALERILGKQRARDVRGKSPELEPGETVLEKTPQAVGHDGPHELPEGSTVLYVPYEQREQAKAHGARWHSPTKSWYAPDGTDLAPLQQWRHDDAVEREPRQDFGQMLRDAGLVVEGDPIMDGRWHRVPVEGGRRTSSDGAYIGNIDAAGRPYGYGKNHRTGEERRYSGADGRPLTTEKRAEIAEQKKESELMRQLRQYRRAQELKEQWEKLPAASSAHPYLQKKGVECYGLRQTEDGCLAMPLQSVDGEFSSYQTIGSDGDKRLASGGRKTGSFHAIGDIEDAQRILICEGYATGASIHRATGKPVVVAVDAGNLQPVAEAIRKKNADAEIAIMADDDHSRETNVGVEKATAAARAVGGVVVVPKLTESEQASKCTDFNDIEQARGAAALSALNAEIDAGFDGLKQESSDFNAYLDRRDPERQAAPKGRDRGESPVAQQDSGAHEHGREPGGKTVDDEQVSKEEERSNRSMQQMMDEYGPKSKGMGRKGPGHGLGL